MTRNTNDAAYARLVHLEKMLRTGHVGVLGLEDEQNRLDYAEAVRTAGLLLEEQVDTDRKWFRDSGPARK